MRMIYKIIIGVLLAAVLMILWLDMIYEIMMNRHLVYFFDRTNIFTDKVAVKVFKENEEVLSARKWFGEVKKTTVSSESTETGDCFAFEIKNEVPSSKWAVLVHGYANEPVGIAHIAKRYYDKGYNLLMPHLRGQGLDKHTYVSMGYYDKYMVKNWCEYLNKKYENISLSLHGVSMGGATVLLTTGEELPSNVKFCVSDCAYASSKGVFHNFMKNITFFLTSPVLKGVNAISKIRKNFDMDKTIPLDAVSRSKIPTLFIHGEEDHFVPFDNMEKLFNACKSEKEKLSVPGSPHSVCSVLGGENYWDKVWDFAEKHSK